MQYGGSADAVRASFTGYNEALAGNATALGTSSTAAAAAKTAAEGLTSAQLANKQSAEDNKKAIDDLKTSVQNYGDVVATARDTSRGYEGAIDAASASLDAQRQKLADGRIATLGIKDATDAQKQSALQWADAQIAAGAGLDISTAAGRDNAASLDAIAKKALDASVANFTNGKSVDEVTAAIIAPGGARDAFIAQAQKMGASTAAASTLADQLGLTKDNVGRLTSTIGQIPKSTTSTADTAPADAAVNATTRRLDALDAKTSTPTVSVNDAASARISTIADSIAALRDRTVTITTQERRVIQNDIRLAENGIAFAGGGPIVGPGTGTSDTAGIWALSNGEHVLTAAEVAAAGGHGEIMRLRRALLAGRVNYAAAGGPVMQQVDSMRFAAGPIGRVPAASMPNAATPAGPRGPLVAIGTIQAVDPAAAIREANTQLRDMLAVHGLDLAGAVR